MNRMRTFILTAATVALAGTGYYFFPEDSGSTQQAPHVDAHVHHAGETFIDTVEGEDGLIAFYVALPKEPRFSDGAPVILNVPTFYTAETNIETRLGFEGLGLVYISVLYPGTCDEKIHVCSEGERDYGGENAIRAVRDVLRFASGDLKDSQGMSISDRVDFPVLTHNVGIYAFSHPGVIATNVMAYYGKELPNVHYVITRESPTMDSIFTLEACHYDDNGKALENPAYHYPDDFSDEGITMDYSTVSWDNLEGRPYFDLNRSGRPDEGDFLFSEHVPTLFGKRSYSRALTQALLDNGVFNLGNWPSDLATPEETEANWPYRQTVGHYSALASFKDFHFMLIYAREDHVMCAPDKPHIHMAYDGLRAQNIWTRINPDSAYVDFINSGFGKEYSEHLANKSYVDWTHAYLWSYESSDKANSIVVAAGVSEMVDRTYENDWTEDLNQPLTSFREEPASTKRR